MIRKIVGYFGELINEMAFRSGYWIGYSEGIDQGMKDTLVAYGLEEEE